MLLDSYVYCALLFLPDNGIGDEGGLLIAQNMPLLKELYVSGCSISAETAKAIAEALTHLEYLESFVKCCLSPHALSCW